MSVILIARFTDNLSTTSIAYKKYSKTIEDTYPTFTICFTGTPEFHWYYELELFKEFELSSLEYEKMMKGEPAFKYHYDLSARLYKRESATRSNKSYGSSQPFHLKISDILIQADLTTENPMHSTFYGNRTDTKSISGPPFNVGFQTPGRICFSRSSNFVNDLIRSEDSLVLNTALMKNVIYENTVIEIYIHHPGQLIRSLVSPSFKSLFRKYKWEDDLEFKILQHTIVRKRSDSTGTCNKDIHDYDLYLQGNIIKQSQCVPLYWKESFLGMTGFEDCTSQSQFQEVYKQILNLENIIKQQDVPCIETHLSTVWNSVTKKDASLVNETLVTFMYTDKYYQEILYLKEFGPESFISNIGGFLGIFLGYSMMQVPDLLGKKVGFDYFDCKNINVVFSIIYFYHTIYSFFHT